MFTTIQNISNHCCQKSITGIQFPVLFRQSKDLYINAIITNDIEIIRINSVSCSWEILIFYRPESYNPISSLWFNTPKFSFREVTSSSTEWSGWQLESINWAYSIDSWSIVSAACGEVHDTSLSIMNEKFYKVTNLELSRSKTIRSNHAFAWASQLGHRGRLVTLHPPEFEIH